MNSNSADENLPLGEPVQNCKPSQPPERRRYEGEYVNLSPVDPANDVAELFRNSHGSRENSRVWTYLPDGPFTDEAVMRDWLRDCEASADPFFLTVSAKEINQRVGVVSFLNINVQMRCLELGNIWYSPIVQRSKVNTETIFLMLTEAFDVLKYRRVEWKCDALNAKSRAAALRLGFSFEGLFRQHYIVKGRNRDTAWFAMLDKDWAAVKRNLILWLYSGESDISLAELNHPLLRTASVV